MRTSPATSDSLTMRAKLWRPRGSEAGANQGRCHAVVASSSPSSSRMVPVAVASPIVTPSGRVVPGLAERVTVNVSSGSTSRSWVVSTEKVAEVCPAGMRRFCPAVAKSVPAVAVSPGPDEGVAASSRAPLGAAPARVTVKVTGSPSLALASATLTPGTCSGSCSEPSAAGTVPLTVDDAGLSPATLRANTR